MCLTDCEDQFMLLSGNNAFVGKVDKLERVPEYKVEIICTKDQIKDAVAALKEAHPTPKPELTGPPHRTHHADFQQ